MSKALKVEEVSSNGRLELGFLKDEATALGRNPDSGIKIASEAVSSEHCIFVPFREHWLFKDLKSTNGSWVNGNKVEPNIPLLVRPGDLIQLADKVIELSPVDGTGYGAPRSLLVFSRGEPVEEFLLPEVGRGLVIGGSKSDLKLDVDVHELPSLVIERRGDRVCAFCIARETTAYLNGKKVERTVNVADRDELTVENYRVIINDPPDTYAKAHAPVYQFEAENTHEIRKATKNMAFGRAAEETVESEQELENQPWNPLYEDSRVLGRDTHPGSRYREDGSGSNSLDVLEDKIVIIIGTLLLVALLIVLFWWVLQ